MLTLTHFTTIDRNKSRLTISGTVAVDTARDYRNFKGIHRAHCTVIFVIAWLSCNFIITSSDCDYMCVFLSHRAIIEQYYLEGFEYKAILIFLEKYHDIRMSMRTLLRRLARFGFHRRGQPASLTQIWRAVNVELTGPGLFITTFL